ncbi:MAG: hypothetical protein ACYTDY_05430 [Planctomycetota bacterium]
MLFAHVTTRIPGEEYDSLLHALGGSVFPTLLFLDAEGGVLGEHRWPRTVESFRESHSAVRRLLAIEAKEKPSRAERVEKLVLLGRLRRLDFDGAKAMLDRLGELSGEQAKRVGEVLANLEAEEIMSPRPATPEQAREVGGELRKMTKAGRIPTDPLLLRRFWGYQLVSAEADRDAEAFAAALEGLRKVLGDDERSKRRLESLERTLEKLRREASVLRRNFARSIWRSSRGSRPRTSSS